MAKRKSVKKKAAKAKKVVSLESSIVTASTGDWQDGDGRLAARGEFRGDVTRDTFNPLDRYTRVLLQQGRVQLDADWNEQTSILLHRLRSLARDIGSEHWGPNGGDGFAINSLDDEPGQREISIGAGHYYVNGLLCEADRDDNGELFTYSNQPDYPIPIGQSIDELVGESGDPATFLIYLDAWERHINYLNDDSIREVALGGPDTATRAKMVCQVKILRIPRLLSDSESFLIKEQYQTFLDLIAENRRPGSGQLRARVKDKSGDDTDPCLVAPESRYRGAENQLYRVEVHTAGVAGNQDVGANLPLASFKWSRENSSVVYPITKLEDKVVTLEHHGRDSRYALKPNDWIEIIDDDYVLQNRAEELLQVDSIDTENRRVTLKSAPVSSVGTDPEKCPYLRRWDQTDGGNNGVELMADENWLDLEDGIQIQFIGTDQQNDQLPRIYQTGDYWLVPARTETGDIEWPKQDGESSARFPHGVLHHYAPLAIASEGDDGGITDLRRLMNRNWS